MIPDVRVYSIMVEHDRAVPMIEQIDQIMLCSIMIVIEGLL